MLREGPFEQVWIQPAAGDAGGALGAALFTWHELLDEPREVMSQDSQFGSLLGPSFSNDQIKTYLDSVEAVYHQFVDEDALVDRIAELIASEQVVGHFSDRAEFGPRARGPRSTLGAPPRRGCAETMHLCTASISAWQPSGFLQCWTPSVKLLMSNSR